MRIKKVNYNKKESVMIYITLAEKLDENVNAEIDNLKKLYKDVAVFVSGKNSVEKALATIIQERA